MDKTAHENAVKKCSLCERVLPIAMFNRRGKYRHSYCKPCHRDKTYESRDARRMRSNAEFVDPIGSARTPS
jgi:PHP family Zn ribbon phosphoesterase